MAHEKDMERMKFDVRLKDRNFNSGFATKNEYQDYLSNLEDSSANAEYIHVEEPKKAPKPAQPEMIPNNQGFGGFGGMGGFGSNNGGFTF